MITKETINKTKEIEKEWHEANIEFEKATLKLKNSLIDYLFRMGFTNVVVEELEEGDDKEEWEEVYVRVGFNWKWCDSDEIRTDGKMEFDTTFENVIAEINERLQKSKNFIVLL